AMGSLNYFSLEKFVKDCERERETRKIWLKTRHDFVVPLYLPEDKGVVKGIREIAEKGGAKNADHTLNNLSSFADWQKRLIEAADKKVYFPELRNSLQGERAKLLRVSKAARTTQLKDTLFPD
ncbi:MAG: hypothetical protein P8X55_00420, partial [Desulfosarcinaceae bacterium]